jgi:hypothetical protein
LHDPALIALYHTAEHLSVTDSTGSPIATQIKRWKAKRNVLGFYDGRPVRILPPPPDGAADERLDSTKLLPVSSFSPIGWRKSRFRRQASRTPSTYHSTTTWRKRRIRQQTSLADRRLPRANYQ